MRSSQTSLKNKNVIVASTKYPKYQSGFLSEIEYAKNVLDEIFEDKRYFALLYEPDEDLIDDWQTNDLVLIQANPVSINGRENGNQIWETLVKERKKAIMYESARENFFNKHCNVIYVGKGTDGYISSEEIAKCEIKEKIDWIGKNVYLGLDLASTFDNTAVSMLCVENGKIYCKSWAFIPSEKVEEKCKKENIDYKKQISEGNCFACGNHSVDYDFVEEFILSLEEEYGVNIIQCGYDLRDATMVAKHLEDNGIEMVEVRQHSSILHQPIKHLKEKILNQGFVFNDNTLLRANFINCRISYDTNMMMYLNKKKSMGK